MSGSELKKHEKVIYCKGEGEKSHPRTGAQFERAGSKRVGAKQAGRIAYLGVLFFISSLIVGCGSDDGDKSDPLRPRIDTQLGAVIGARSPAADAQGVRAFRGIPYVAAPVGPNRFRAPQAHVGWDSPREASAFGPRCPQAGWPGEPTLTTDEDCLTLNIWTPNEASSLPVMVWIHGGGFTNGAGSEPAFDGELLAREQNVVVVTFNYRLGVLGFLAADEIAAGGAAPLGNMGLRDQIAALEFVRDNIQSFGGDPAAVTLFGESAGGGSVTALLGTSSADGLYRAAIVQSGGGGFGFRDAADADVNARPQAIVPSMAAALGCQGDVAECFRNAAADDLVAALPALDLTSVASASAVGPIVDGSLIKEQPYDRIRKGNAPNVPLIMGTTSDEFGFVRLFIDDGDDYLAALAENFGDQAAAIAKIYPVASFDSVGSAVAAAFGDLTFVCPARELAMVAPNATNMYLFDHALTGPQAGIGAIHALDLPYTFGTLSELPFDAEATAEDELVSRFMRDAWGQFARTGQASSDWPVWSEQQKLLRISAAPGLISLDGTRCDALRQAGILPL